MGKLEDYSLRNRKKVDPKPEQELYTVPKARKKGKFPPLKHQLEYVKTLNGVAPNWKDLGLQLLYNNDTYQLGVIDKDHQRDCLSCCSKLFDIWLTTRPDACWDDLIHALYAIKLRTAGNDVKNFCEDMSKMFMTEIANLWKSEGIDLKLVKTVIKQDCPTDAMVTACEENNHSDFFMELSEMDEFKSLNLLKRIATSKGIKSDDTLHMISEYRGKPIESNQSQSARNIPTGQPGFFTSLFKFGRKHIFLFITLGIISVAVGYGGLVAVKYIAGGDVIIFAASVADYCFTAGS